MIAVARASERTTRRPLPSVLAGLRKPPCQEGGLWGNQMSDDGPNAVHVTLSLT